jgi:hypothetical protein
MSRLRRRSRSPLTPPAPETSGFIRPRRIGERTSTTRHFAFRWGRVRGTRPRGDLLATSRGVFRLGGSDHGRDEGRISGGAGSVLRGGGASALPRRRRDRSGRSSATSPPAAAVRRGPPRELAGGEHQRDLRPAGAGEGVDRRRGHPAHRPCIAGTARDPVGGRPPSLLPPPQALAVRRVPGPARGRDRAGVRHSRGGEARASGCMAKRPWLPPGRPGSTGSRSWPPGSKRTRGT